MHNKGYIQHSDKVVAANDQFKHVMAITLDPTSNNKKGIIRCITSRVGDVQVRGYVDRSELYAISGNSLEHFIIGERLQIKNEKEIIAKLAPEGWECIGLEDPDIWIDPKTSLMHVYFTIPIKPPETKEKMRIHLGHAVGKGIESLEMTMPVLLDEGVPDESAKEVSIAPLNSKGLRLNLFESRDRSTVDRHSIVRVGIAEDMGGNWKYGPVAFHPKNHQDMGWIAGHASPGPLFSKNFIDLGGTRLLGVINGREANEKVGDKITYGMFSVGLFVYDYEIGKIEWVSPGPFIRDTEAKTITFASCFVETGLGEGILYAHVDDSFVRAYTLNAKEVFELVPNNFKAKS